MTNEISNLTNFTAEILDIKKLKKLNSLEIFSEITCGWLSELSRFLLRDPRTKKYPDVATFAFFCRKANLSKLRLNHYDPNEIRIGKGIAFHIAPSNVPVNFAYTLLTGLLAGNINIVKIPSKHFEQIDIIIHAINTTLENSEFKEVKKRIFVVKYDTNSDITSMISKISDLRVIWGGNETVSNIKNIKSNPKSLDISFPDRYSISAIDAKSYIEFEDKKKLSELFYNDTYLFDQNACTAPHSIFWIGSDENINKSKIIFWKLLEKTINEKQYDLNGISTIDKLVTFYSHSMNESSIRKINKNNLIWRVNNIDLNRKVDDFRCASGYFNEFKIDHIDKLNNIIKRNYQTLSYFGIEKDELKSFFKRKRPLGIDRAVSIGKTLDFSLNWDGYDLINQMSRVISIA